MGNGQAANFGFQLVGDDQRVFIRGFGQHAGELFTTIACHQVCRAAQAGLECTGHQAQRVVPGLVAIAVVEQLEKIHIQQDQRQRRVVARRPGPLGGHLLVEIAAVKDTGQAIQKHQLAQQVGLELQCQVGFDPGPHDIRIDGLGNKVHCTQAQTVGFLCRIGVGGNKDDRYVARALVGLKALADFKTVQARHHHVEQDQIGRVAAANAQCLLTVGCHEHLVVSGKAAVHHLDVDRLVVHHQQLGPAMRAVQQFCHWCLEVDHQIIVLLKL